jgi:hypothetical protein
MIDCVRDVCGGGKGEDSHSTIHNSSLEAHLNEP